MSIQVRCVRQWSACRQKCPDHHWEASIPRDFANCGVSGRERNTTDFTTGSIVKIPELLSSISLVMSSLVNHRCLVDELSDHIGGKVRWRVKCIFRGTLGCIFR